MEELESVLSTEPLYVNRYLSHHQRDTRDGWDVQVRDKHSDTHFHISSDPPSLTDLLTHPLTHTL